MCISKIETIAHVPPMKDGYTQPPEGPGLGVELRPDVFERNNLIRRVTQEVPKGEKSKSTRHPLRVIPGKREYRW